MILANECVAGLLSSRQRPALYRVHEPPEPQSVELLLARLAELDVPTPPAPEAETMAPREAARVAAAASELVAEYTARAKRGEEAFRTLVLRSLEAGPLRPAQPRPLRPRQPRLLPLHLADPPLSRPRRAPRADPRARRRRRRRPGRPRRARPSTARCASARRPRSSTSPTSSASPGCSSRGCSSSAGSTSSTARSSA